ncbi:MAG TPA: tetratricopeptide repeat protein [Stellaceae bacterium]|nr:tetratricopeptide repeat protein [Stellaceae bacterium]
MRRLAGALALVLAIGLGGCAGGAPGDIAAGARAQQRGDYAEAIRRYTLALQSPGLPAKTRIVVLDGRSVAYIQSGDREKAIADADEAIRLSPDDAHAYNNRGYAYLGKGQYDLAIADLTVAIQLSPTELIYYENRGDVYFLKSQYDLALADYEEIVHRKPEAAVGHERRGRVLLRRQDYDRAIAEFSRALELQHDLIPALTGRGVAYSHQGQVEKAMADFDGAIRVKSDDAAAYQDRAVYEFALGRFDKSADDFEHVIKLWPMESSAVVLLHVARGRLGKDDKAEYERNVATLSQSAGPNPIAAFYLGQVTEEQLQHLAERGDQKAQEAFGCQVAFHTGEYELLRNAEGAARPRLEKAAAGCAGGSLEEFLASAELKRISR